MDDEEQTLAPGAEVAGYRVVRQVGSGGMGAVYEALHTRLKKRVALKAMYPKLAARSEMFQRFLREGEAAARIRHPHVVDVVDVGLFGSTPYLVMEYLEGEDLGHYLRQRGPLEIAEALEIVIPVASALHSAHLAGVVHRDLKPENIFLSRNHAGEIHPKVLDFGISKMINPNDLPSDGMSTAILATPHYMSPEQTRSGQKIDRRTDQYSLAVVLYHCVVGALPFRAKSLLDLMDAIVAGNAVQPSTVRSDLPPGFEEVLMRAMHREAEKRFATISDFAMALLAFATPPFADHWRVDFRSGQTLPMGSRYSQVSLRPPAREEPSAAADPRAPTPVKADVPTPSRRRNLAYGLAAGCVLVALAFVWRSGAHRTTVATAAGGNAEFPPVTAIRGPTYHVGVSVDPHTARIQLDGHDVGVGTYSSELSRDGSVHVLRVAAAGFEPQSISFRDEPPPSDIALVPESSVLGAHEATAGAPVHHAPAAPPSDAAHAHVTPGSNGAPILN